MITSMPITHFEWSLLARIRGHEPWRIAAAAMIQTVRTDHWRLS